jgi:hypothetical protein
MKLLRNGSISYDSLDIIYLSLFFGSCLSYLNKKIKKKSIDPIVLELKKKSPLNLRRKHSPLVTPVTIEGKPLLLPRSIKKVELPLLSVRGGELVKEISLIIRSKKLFRFLQTLNHVQKKKKLIRFILLIFSIFNSTLKATTGFQVVYANGYLDYTHFFLLFFPSTVMGFVLSEILNNPLVSAMVPLTLLGARGIEIEEPEDIHQKCRVLCEAVKDWNNRQELVEMTKLVQNNGIGFPVDQLPEPLTCIEETLSLTQRFKLRELIKNTKLQNRITYFRHFIKKFPDCDANPEEIYQQIIGNAPK